MSRGDGWIQVYGGSRFWPLDARPEDFDINVIAHALSNQCRYTGHTSRFYSVAEHSILVSRACDPADALDGLLHDATEAYLVDIPRPLKQLPEFGEYRRIEKRLHNAIAEWFGTRAQIPASVHRADLALLVAEARDLMQPIHPEFFSSCVLDEMPEAWPERIEGYMPHTAKRLFLARFRELSHK